MPQPSASPPPIWMYWEGPLPGYLDLCIATVKKHHPDVQVLNPATFALRWTADRHVPIDHLRPQHRADFIRAYLLHHYGGLWLDVDMILLNPLDDFFNLPAPFTFCAYLEDPRQYANDFLFARRGCPIARNFYLRVRDHLVRRRPIDWLEIGAYALKPAIRTYPENAYTIPAPKVCPISWKQMHRLEAPGDAADLIKPWRYGVLLSNHSMTEATRQLSRQEALEADTLLGDLLRRALA